MLKTTQNREQATLPSLLFPSQLAVGYFQEQEKTALKKQQKQENNNNNNKIF